MQLNLIEGNLVELAVQSQEPTESRHFSMNAYSGATVNRNCGRMVFSLSGMEIKNKKIPILKNHDANQIVGRSETIVKNEKGIFINGNMSRKTLASKEVCELNDEGFPWQASIGVEPLDVRFVDEKCEVDVNGRKEMGPLYLIERSVLRESSFVPVGADGDTCSYVLSFFDKEKKPMAAELKPSETLQETPPAMTDEEKKKKEEEEAAKIKGEEKMKLQAMQKMYGDPSFVLEQYLAGNSSEKIELAWKDQQIENLKAENLKQIEALKKENASQMSAGAEPVKFSGSATNSGASFIQLAREYSLDNKCGMIEAMKIISERYPESHKKYKEGK